MIWPRRSEFVAVRLAAVYRGGTTAFRGDGRHRALLTGHPLSSTSRILLGLILQLDRRSGTDNLIDPASGKGRITLGTTFVLNFVGTATTDDDDDEPASMAVDN
jgi:hypothetical protein